MQYNHTSQPPCDVCTDFKSWTKSKPSPKPAHNDPSSNPSPWGDYEPVPPPPADSIELGQSTWTFLHTAAAYYPETPTQVDQNAIKALIDSIAEVYPCKVCATHLRDYLKTHPVDTRNTDSVSQWMCVMHNNVNLRLGKPEFDCKYVMDRWRRASKNLYY